MLKDEYCFRMVLDQIDIRSASGFGPNGKRMSPNEGSGLPYFSTTAQRIQGKNLDWLSSEHFHSKQLTVATTLATPRR